MRGAAIASIGLCCSLYLRSVQGSDLEDIIESTFREAVVKIDVSTIAPVIKNNVNICVSEGTGFLVSSNYVVTAEHVYQLPPECGERIIIVKSKAHNLQKLASVVAAKDDVALLKVDAEFPKDMCALALLTQDVYDTKAIRFGIPGGFTEPPGAIGVKIGKRVSDFSPLVVMMPTATEKGESGGPIIYQFNVVGLTRAKHDRYPAYSFMTVGSTIRSLMAGNSIQPQGHICNPVESSMWTNPPPNIYIAKTGHVVGFIKLDERLGAGQSSIATDFVDNFNKKLVGSSVTVSSSDTNVTVLGQIRNTYEKHAIFDKVSNTVAEVSMKLRQNLWDQYVAEAEKSGKWSNASIFVAEPKGPERTQSTGMAGTGAKLSTEQRTKIVAVIRNEKVEPVTNVNFSVSVGSRIPRDVRLYLLPPDVVTIYPEWRGYNYILVREQIAVIDPETLEIVAILDL